MTARIGTVSREEIATELRRTLDQGGTEALVLSATVVIGALMDSWDREGEESDRLAEALLTLQAEAPLVLAHKMASAAAEHGQFLSTPSPFEEAVGGQR